MEIKEGKKEGDKAFDSLLIPGDILKTHKSTCQTRKQTENS